MLSTALTDVERNAPRARPLTGQGFRWLDQASVDHRGRFLHLPTLYNHDLSTKKIGTAKGNAYADRPSPLRTVRHDEWFLIIELAVLLFWLILEAHHHHLHHHRTRTLPSGAKE